MSHFDGNRFIYDFDAKHNHECFAQYEDYIRSIEEFLSAEEIQEARKHEYFSYNVNVGGYGVQGVPGLRPWHKGNQSEVFYFSRFDKSTFNQMIDKICSHAESKINNKYLIGITFPMFRITTPKKTKFYSVDCQIDSKTPKYGEYGNLFAESARSLGSTLATFERGKFVLETGEVFNFSELEMQWLEGKRIPRNW